MNWKKYPVGFKLGKKNPVHQTRYFKLENWKNPVQIDRGFTHFDQPDLIIFQNLKFKSLSRWNSLSNDEMVRIREDRFMLDFHKFNTRIPPQPPPSNMLPKSNMVQMANVTVMPKSDEPRKFSKYNPPRKRRSRNATEELIYIRQNFPSERY